MIETSAIIYIIGKITPVAVSSIQNLMRRKRLDLLSGKMDNVSGKMDDIKKELNNIAKDLNAILSELQLVNCKLDKLTDWSMNQISQKGLIVFQLLSDLFTVKNSTTLKKCLMMIYEYSTELLTIDINSKLFDTPDKVDQIKNLNCLGYWGRYLYFSFYKEIECMEKEVYSCISKYPLQGGIIFPDEYFIHIVPAFCAIQKSLKNGISLVNMDTKNIDVLSQYGALPSNIQVPLLEIQIEEETERLQQFAISKLKMSNYE